MNLQGIRAGDLVACDVKGRVFIARVEGVPAPDGLPVEPITKGVTYRTVTARQVTEHYKRMGRGR